MSSTDNRRGILYMATGMAFFIGNDALAKLASETLPGNQVIFIRGVFASLLMLVVCTAMGAFRRDMTTGRLPGAQLLNPRLLLRASLDAMGTLLYLTALFRMPLGNATAINMATPLLLTLMAVIAFREQVSLARWLAITVGFGGVLLIVQPSAAGFTDGNSGWALLCLAGTVLLSLRDLVTRVIPAHISSLLVALSAVLAIPVLAGAVLLFQGWQSVTARHLWLLAGSGALLACGFVQFVRALRMGEISIVLPFRYTGLLFAMLLGWLLWGDVPNPLAWCGVVLLVGAGVFMLTHGSARTAPQPLDSAAG